MEQQKTSLNIIIFVILLLAIGGTAVYFMNVSSMKKETTKSAQTNVVQEVVRSPVEENTANPAASSWKTYTNKAIGFEIEYPTDWYVFFESPTNHFTTLASVPFEKRSNGVGTPESGPWIDIENTNCKINTDGTQEKYVSGEDYGGTGESELRVKKICKGSFVLSLTMWEKDMNNQEYQNILDAMAKSFQLTTR